MLCLRSKHMVPMLIAGIVSAVGGTTATAQNVIAHYSFDETLADTTTNGLDLTTGAGTEQYAPGKFGQAIDLINLTGGAGTGNYHYNSSPLFDFGTGNFAVSFWYQSDHQTGVTPTQFSVGQIVTKDNHTTANPGWGVRLTNDGSDNAILGYTLEPAGSDNTIDFGSTLAPADDDTVYHHIVLQRKGDVMESWLDGELLDSRGGVGSANLSAPAFAFAIGARGVLADGTLASGGGYGLDGRIDELWVFGDTLVSSQIQSLYTSNILPEIEIGDFNSDFEIDLVDFGILRDNMQGHLDGPVFYEQGDINQDGLIDLNDFGMFKEIFPGGAAGLEAALAAATGAAVPEPSSVVLALGGLAGLLAIARRRNR